MGGSSGQSPGGAGNGQGGDDSGGDGPGGDGPGGDGPGGDGPGGAGSGGDGPGGAGGEGGTPEPLPDELDNPGWEVGTAHSTMPGWTNEGTVGASYIEYNGARTGYGRMGHWIDYTPTTPPYTARTFQTVGPIPNGTYSFSVWVMRAYFDEQYLFARGFNASDPTQEMTAVTSTNMSDSAYVQVTLSGIPVTSGECTVGIYSAAPAGSFANFDDASFTLE